MKISTFATKSALTAALLAASVSAAMAATAYTVTSVSGITIPRAISPTGIIVGDAAAPIDDTYREIAVLRDAAGTIHELIPGSESNSKAFDINASGQVVIYSDGTVVYGQGSIVLPAGVYVWQNDVLSPLNLNVPIDPYTVSLAINDSAQVMGTGSFTSGTVTQKHAFLAKNGVVTDLGTLPGASSSYASGINKNGDVVGYSYDANNQPRAVLWRNGSLVDLGVLPGATSSVANSVNDQGVVVGSSGGRLFTWKDGLMTDLGKYSADTVASARTINNNNEITGYANIPGTYTYYSFKWSQGAFTTLDPVIQNGKCSAGDINDVGQINMSCYYGNYVISPTAPAVDLGVITSANMYPALQGDPLTYSVDVYNVGSLNASNVQLTNPLPVNSSLVSVTTSQGSCGGSAVISCALGNLASGGKATVKLTIIPTAMGSVTNSPNVSSSEIESNTPTNSASNLAYVVAGGTNLDISMVPSATTISRNSNVTFTITVKNYGPGLANNSVMTDTLPSFLKLVSASTTVGSCSGSTTVSCNLGTLANGASATIKIVAKGVSSGTGINTAKVSTTSTDTYLGNNSFGYSIRVK